jgi:hypothetical protein
MENRKEMDELADIIKAEYNVDVMSKKRSLENVDGRLVFCKILTDRGYGVSTLARYLKKHHSSTIHYRNLANDLLETNELFFSKYKICKDKFMCGKAFINETSTKDELLNQIDSLILERNILLKKINKHQRLKNIIEFIDSRTPIGNESLVLRKINLMFNGLTDYGQEFEW